MQFMCVLVFGMLCRRIRRIAQQSMDCHLAMGILAGRALVSGLGVTTGVLLEHKFQYPAVGLCLRAVG